MRRKKRKTNYPEDEGEQNNEDLIEKNNIRGRGGRGKREARKKGRGSNNC